MSAQHPVTVTPFQLKLKQLCIAVETLFECRRGRVAFLLNMIGTAALYWAIMVVQARWLRRGHGRYWPSPISAKGS